MGKDLFPERQRGLEESYFAKQEEAARRALRERADAAQRKADLAAVSGIADHELLEALLAADIDASRFGVLALVPLVDMAWADGALDERERDAVLLSARRAGLSDDEVALLDGWLRAGPDSARTQLWRRHVEAKLASLAEQDRSAYRAELMRRVRAVAEAAGGILGLGNRISSAEQRMLQDLDALLS